MNDTGCLTLSERSERRLADGKERMKRLTPFLLSLVIALPLGATAQAPEILKFGGKTYFIHTNPLTPVLMEKPGRLPEAGAHSTGLWRGYIGSWSIRGNRLMLDDVKVPTRHYMDDDAPEEKQFQSAMKPLFGTSEPQVATWFTGNLIVPTGEMVNYVHMGYGSTYSSYMVLTIVKGVVEKQQDLNQEEFETFRRKQYAAYKKTPEYAQAKAETKRGDPMPEDMSEEFLFQFASEEYLSRIFEPIDQ